MPTNGKTTWAFAKNDQMVGPSNLLAEFHKPTLQTTIQMTNEMTVMMAGRLPGVTKVSGSDQMKLATQP